MSAASDPAVAARRLVALDPGRVEAQQQLGLAILEAGAWAFGLDLDQLDRRGQAAGKLLPQRAFRPGARAPDGDDEEAHAL